MKEKATNALLSEVATEINILSSLSYRVFLKQVYVVLKQRLKGYTYLQYAEDLGFSHTNVIHLVIRGKRKLNPSSVLKLIEAFGFKKDNRLYFEALVKYNNARTHIKRESAFLRLTQLRGKSLIGRIEGNYLKYYNEWYHPVVRELVNSMDIQCTPEAISEIITPRVTPEQVRKSLQLLEELELISFNKETGKYEQTKAQVTTGNEVEGIAILRYHQNVIDMGKDSITTVSHKRRDISAVTTCVSEETANMMKSRIQEFRKELLQMAQDSGPGDQVYQVNIQLFPFTKGKVGKSKK